jgi:glycosyltransferase involved in cell wall biosynthesis
VNILVAHNFYKQPGGEDQCVTAEVAMLEAHGHQVSQYFLHNRSIDTLGRLELAARTIWSQSAFQEMRDLLRDRRPQIVHFHNTFPLISPAAYYAARAEGARVVQTLHNYRLLCANALLFRNGEVCEDCLNKSILWPAVAGKCYRGSRAATATVAAMLMAHRALGTWSRAVNTYIALTEFSRNKFVAGGLPADKIAVKPNFVYPDPGASEGTAGYGVFAGRLSAEKGVGTLLEAWRRLGGTLPLKIVGDGPLAASVKEAAMKYPGIQWLRSQPLEAVYRLIGDASMMVVPSQCYENFPRTIAEAFAKGTPVIASNLGAMAAIVDHGRTGLLFEPGDPDDLVAKLHRVLGDPLKLAQMRQEARQEFEMNFSVESNYKALMGIYQKSLDGSRQPGPEGRDSEVPL